jgi:hypothetical protein
LPQTKTTAIIGHLVVSSIITAVSSMTASANVRNIYAQHNKRVNTDDGGVSSFKRLLNLRPGVVSPSYDGLLPRLTAQPSRFPSDRSRTRITSE